MPLSQDTLRFIREHRRDDVRSLALHICSVKQRKGNGRFGNKRRIF